MPELTNRPEKVTLHLARSGAIAIPITSTLVDFTGATIEFTIKKRQNDTTTPLFSATTGNGKIVIASENATINITQAEIEAFGFDDAWHHCRYKLVGGDWVPLVHGPVIVEDMPTSS